MWRVAANRCLIRGFSDLALPKPIFNTEEKVTEFAKTIMHNSSASGLVPLHERSISEISTEFKSSKPSWYHSVTIPDPDSPDYLAFEKLWNEECDAVAREINGNTISEN